MAYGIGPKEVAMKLDPIRSRKIVDVVVERIEHQVIEGSLSDGDKLPSEEQLAAQLGVGRRSVREALKVLETKGLVEVHKGVGAVIKRTDLDGFLDVLTRNMGLYLRINKADFEHITQLRWLLEGAALDQCALLRNAEKLEELADTVAQQRLACEEGDYLQYQNWHFRFHQKIVDTLENPAITMIYTQVLALVREPMEKSGSDPKVHARAIRDHKQILEALKRGSATDARQVLEKHLERFIFDMQNV
jgi:GntR family transcriptional repressor for pyruvate dehydrogenase complex